MIRSMMTFLCLFAAVIVFAFTPPHCKMLRNKNLIFKKVDVDSVTVEKLNTDRREVTLTIHGTFPTPAYTFDHFDIKVKKNSITITPWSLYDRKKIVIQMIVRFTEQCVVKGLDSGHYELKVVGRSKTLMQQVDN